jgi:hypothetical protein
MFKKMSNMVLSGWHLDGEGALVDTLCDSYLKKNNSTNGTIVHREYPVVSYKTIVMDGEIWIPRDVHHLGISSIKAGT